MASFLHRVSRLLSSPSLSSHLRKHSRFPPSATNSKTTAVAQSLSIFDGYFSQQANAESHLQRLVPTSYKFGHRRMAIRQAKGVHRRANTSTTDANSAIELALDSVVKIFTVSCSPNYLLPWQNKSQRETMGSGFVIPGKRILTNAHVVADHSFVLVRKHGSPTKYKADVKAVGHECDLAILIVESEEFWDGMNPLELGDIPFLQEAVALVGYPQELSNVYLDADRRKECVRFHLWWDYELGRLCLGFL